MVDDLLDLSGSADRLLEVMKIIDEEFARDILPTEIVEIVKFHAKGAAAAGVASGWIPGAGAVALATVSVGFIWSMYLRINSKIGLKLSENILKTLASGIATNLVAYFAAAIIGNVVFSFIPIVGSATAAVIAGGIAYALTLVSGAIYLKILIHIFNAKKNPNTMSAEDLKNMADTIIKDEDIEEALRKAKNSYKHEG